MSRAKLRQLSLWDSPVSTRRPPAVAVRTSIAAAEAIEEIAPLQRGRVYQEIAQRRERGATREEISEALGMKLASVCARANELLEQTLIYQTDATRLTSSGRGAKVLFARRQ
jgi:hypothetical protein